MRTVMAGLNGFGEGRYKRMASGFALLIILWASTAFAADPAKKPIPGSDIFEGTNVIHLNIDIPPDGMRILGRYHWGNGNEDKPVARATVKEGDKIYTNVGIQLKGAAGSFRPINDRPALTLKFDKFNPGQKFHGLEKISLNNSIQDPSFMSEKICREMYEAAGVPVPRADYAVLTLNGRNLGLYVLVEGYNKQFLRRYFKNVSGNLYDGGFCREITDDLNVNSGDKPNDKSDLRRLASAAMSARGKNSLDELSKILDIDRFLTMVALEVIQCHWDGYTMNRNNYRLYHDMDSGRMVFMPHGMDQMFGMGERSSPQSDIMPPINGFVSGAVLGTTEGRRLYLNKLAQVRTNVFDVEAVTNRVREIEARIRPYSRRRGNIDMLCENIVLRGQSLDRQIQDPPQPTTFTNGIFRPRGWRPRNFDGTGIFDIGTSQDQRPLLHIVANGHSSASSWRTQVALPAGRYRFEGYTRTRGAGQGSQGAHLRISGAVSTPVLHGDADWKMLSYQFEVEEPTRDVVLICELKGTEGEAWFDTTTLKIRRLE